MWEFRRRPDDVNNPQPTEELADLFEQIPNLGILYYFRWQITAVFETAPNREEAERRLQEIRENNSYDDLDLSPFWTTYDNWKDSILAYFDERKTSGVVEGVNNKARVITKRSYGLKSSDSLWTRLLLDLNHATDAVTRTVKQTRELIQGIRAKMIEAYT
jgi:hypothetical protein